MCFFNKATESYYLTPKSLVELESEIAQDNMTKILSNLSERANENIRSLLFGEIKQASKKQYQIDNSKLQSILRIIITLINLDKIDPIVFAFEMATLINSNESSQNKLISLMRDCIGKMTQAKFEKFKKELSRNFTDLNLKQQIKELKQQPKLK